MIWFTYVDVWIRCDGSPRTKAEKDRLKHWYNAWVATETGSKITGTVFINDHPMPPRQSDMWMLVEGESGSEAEGRAHTIRKYFIDAGYVATLDYPSNVMQLPTIRIW